MSTHHDCKHGKAYWQDCEECKTASVSDSPELVGCEDCEKMTVEDIKAWADGIQGALGTEYADKVTPEEIRISWAIVNAPQ